MVFITKHTNKGGTKYNFKYALAGKNQVCPKAAYIFVSIPNPKGQREFGVFILVNQHITHSKEKRGLSDEAREVVYDLTKQLKKPKEIANILKSKNIEFRNKTDKNLLQSYFFPFGDS